MDSSSSFLAPAQLRVLLLPIHPIKRSKFQQYAQRIRELGSKVALSDVPRDIRGDRGELADACS